MTGSKFSCFNAKKLRLLVHQLIEGSGFSDTLRFCQNRFNSLFFQSDVTHIVHQLFIFAVESITSFRSARRHLFDQPLAFFVRFSSLVRMTSPSSRPTTTRRLACSSNSSRGSSRACSLPLNVAQPDDAERRFRCRSATRSMSLALPDLRSPET